MALDIRYARNGGVAIAYQVVGDGATDLAYVPDYCSNLVYGWEVRHWREFYERLAQSFRLILFDKRGTGLSDHGGQFTALETLPTLVMYRPALDAERNGLEVTDLIPSAHALRVSGSDYGQIHLSPEIPEEVARFVAREEIPEVPDSVLATVLFTERRLDRAGGRARGSCVARAARAAPCSRPPGAGPFPRRGARHRGRRLLRDVRRPGAGYPLRPGTRRRRSRSRARVARRRPHRRVRAPRRQGRGPGRLDRCPGRATAEASEALVSQTVKDLVAGTGLVLEDRGERELKGVPGSWRLYRATSE